MIFFSDASALGPGLVVLSLADVAEDLGFACRHLEHGADLDDRGDFDV